MSVSGKFKRSHDDAQGAPARRRMVTCFSYLRATRRRVLIPAEGIQELQTLDPAAVLQVLRI